MQGTSICKGYRPTHERRQRGRWPSRRRTLLQAAARWPRLRSWRRRAGRRTNRPPHSPPLGRTRSTLSGRTRVRPRQASGGATVMMAAPHDRAEEGRRRGGGGGAPVTREWGAAGGRPHQGARAGGDLGVGGCAGRKQERFAGVTEYRSVLRNTVASSSGRRRSARQGGYAGGPVEPSLNRAGARTCPARGAHAVSGAVRCGVWAATSLHQLLPTPAAWP